MPEALEDGELRLRQQPFQLMRDGDWKNLVFLPPCDRDWHVDAMQPFRQHRIVQPWLPREPRRGVTVLELKVDAFGRHRSGEARFGIFLVVKELARHLLWPEQEDFRGFGARRGDAGGADEDERADAGS